MVDSEPSIEQIQRLSYVDLLAFMGESNLPPGGFSNIANLIDFCHIHESSRVLHVGSSAGFLSREIARITGAHVVGVDINPNMVKSAQANAEREGLASLCSYACSDICAYRSDEPFDVVLTGGSLAFVRDHASAIRSMVANAKPYGFVALCELFYRESPSPALRERVASIIGNQVPEYRQDYWTDLAESCKELCPWKRDIRPVRRATDDELKAYCAQMAEWASGNWSDEAKAALAARILEYMEPFNENMGYLSAITLAYRHIPTSHEPLLYI